MYVSSYTYYYLLVRAPPSLFVMESDLWVISMFVCMLRMGEDLPAVIVSPLLCFLHLMSRYEEYRKEGGEIEKWRYAKVKVNGSAILLLSLPNVTFLVRWSHHPFLHFFPSTMIVSSSFCY